MGEAVQAGQLLLSLDFSGQGEYLQALQDGQLGETVVFLIEQISAYKSGRLCH